MMDFDHDFLPDHEDEFWYRELQKKSGEDGQLDISALAVTVMTLGLILVVEVCKHKLDHAAHGRPFYTSVLETLYTELTILGIVEFLVWLLQTYYKDYDKDAKALFAKVHFGLFYTAILTSLQTVFTAFFATRISKKLWVKTEALQLNHYVEIREEFDRTKVELHELKGISPDNGDDISELTYDGDGLSIRSLLRGIANAVRHPYLEKKYHDLLVQVRFHEMRVHFLQAYDLPLKFKISDYLMRSELRVLMNLVSVSSFAWLLVAGLANLLYYSMGMVAYSSQDGDLVGDLLTWIFVALLAVFVLMAVVLYVKVQRIFSALMHAEELWDMKSDDKEMLTTKQLELFWFSSPKLVIGSIQFMNFGFALALSTVLVFWNSINKGDIESGWYLLLIAISYSIFLYVVAKVIPMYTLCRNLGQLVDMKRLQESVANFRLEEARRVELEKSLRFVPGDWIDDTNEDTKSDKLSTSIRTAPLNSSSLSLSQRSTASNTSDQENAELMAELVKMDTDSLRVSLPVAEKEELERREQLRKSRKKSLSDGVTSMSIRSKITKDDFYIEKTKSEEKTPITSETTPNLRPEDTSMESLRDRRRQNRKQLSKSVSDGVALMRAAKFVEPIPEEQEVEERTSTPPALPPMIPEDMSIDSSSDVMQAEDQRDVVVFNGNLKKEDSRPTPRQQLQQYYLSKRFVLLSNVFGTMVAFFMVGQRVGGFLESEGIIFSNEFVFFAFPLNVTFWVEFVWLLMFIVTSILIFHTIGWGGQQGKYEKRVVVGATIDTVICGICLVLLCVAESQRCCTDFAETPNSDVNESQCSCPTFGSRRYGGLGSIEPFTCLVALRVLRHGVAKWLEKRIRSKSLKIKSGEVTQRHVSTNMDPFAVFEDSQDGHGEDHHTHEDRGTMTELWQIGIARYPGIVAKHGEFSQELFRAMLGMPIEATAGGDMESNEKESDFSYPHSHLVLNMQRGERKLLPIVDRWSVVDIVMTSKEIVYFECIEADSENISYGKKGRQLCDIAVGRSVVGQLELSEIESVHVEREENHGSLEEESEDIVTIRTFDGYTLCLRFSSVSVDSTNPGYISANGELEAQSLQWAEAVVRFCNPGQLKQSLPELGEGNQEALRGSLVVYHHKKHHHDGHGKEAFHFPNLSNFLK